MNMRKTTSVALFAGIFALVSIGVCAYTVHLTTKMGTELVARAQTIADINERIRSFKSLAEIYEDSKEERLTLSAFALTEEEVGDFLTQIEALGIKEGVTINTSALKVEKIKGEGDILSVEFVLEGREENVRNMIDLFETLPYPSSIASLSLTRTTKESMRGNIKILITLVTYDR